MGNDSKQFEGVALRLSCAYRAKAAFVYQEN